jgi:hypothetical protein
MVRKKLNQRVLSNSFIYLPQSFLWSSVLVVSLFISVICQAQTKPELALDDECFKAFRAKATQRGLKTDVATYNGKCDQEWALKNGNTLQYIYQAYAERIVKVAEEKPLSELIASGICLDADNSQDACVARLKREALAVKVDTRKKLLQNNRARMDMHTDQKPTFIDSSAEALNEPKGTILNDLYVISENFKKAKELEKVYAPQPIDFSKNMSSLEDANILSSYKMNVPNTQSRDILGLDADNFIEIEGNHSNDALNTKFHKALAAKADENIYSAKNFKADTSLKQRYLDEKIKSKDKVTIKVKDNLAVQAFNEIMDSVNQQAMEKNRSANNRHPTSLADPGKKNTYAFPTIDPNVTEDKEIKKTSLDVEIDDDLTKGELKPPK